MTNKKTLEKAQISTLMSLAMDISECNAKKSDPLLDLSFYSKIGDTRAFLTIVLNPKGNRETLEVPLGRELLPKEFAPRECTLEEAIKRLRKFKEELKNE